MDLGLEGKRALVAAASKGLGRAVAEALAAEGADLAICARNADELEATAEALRETHGVEVLAVPTDLAEGDQVEAFTRQALDRLGGCDVLFTNSGGRPPGQFDELDEAAWQAAVDGTLMAAVRLIRGVLPSMREQGWGRIVCSTSIAAKQPVDNLMLSNAIFAAVHGLAKTLANEEAENGITVNCVNPGPFQTDRIEGLARQQADSQGIPLEQALANWGRATQLGRIGDPAEFGTTVAYLASEQAGFLTGESVLVDGGASRALF